MPRMHGSCLIFAALLFFITPAFAEDDQPAPPDIAARRMEVMKSRIDKINVSSADATVPKRMHATPLFRYDDETRGYVDGTVWRLGDTGRPLAIVTAELHPDYLDSGPRVVYDLLSLTDKRFTMRSADLTGWSPQGSAVAMQTLPNGPTPASTPAARLAQIKQQARRFTGTQEVTEMATQFVHLRLLPREIDRYAPSGDPHAHGAIFLLVNGRNPALVLLIETDGAKWQWGVGRLTLPSNLELHLDDVKVWAQPRNASGGSNSPYYATNVQAEFP
ncbi:MAG TPA: hypothetical protein VM165_06050 [Planctomycetaceae bacterium]|nr:hypothetical protein [Planctomycetaceae bacterium]